MTYYLIALALGFLLSAILVLIIIPRILIISARKRLFDSPGQRKIHHLPVPRLGGVSFFPSILFSTTFIFALTELTFKDYFSTGEPSSEFLFLCSGLTLLYLIGIADDMVGVGWRLKMVIQFMSACMLPLAGLCINDFYGLFLIHHIPIIVGMPLTILLVMFIINAINLIDGIDGLASGTGIIVLGVYTVLFAYTGEWSYSLLSIISLGVLCPFFYYNVFGNADKGRKIFMGDSGSLTLGYILATLTIKFIMNHGAETGGKALYDGSIIIAFSLLLVPCLDMIRVILHRLRFHQNPFLPDKNHIHHKFLALGFTPRQTLVILLCLSLAFGITNILLIAYIDYTMLFLMDVMVWTTMNIVLTKKILAKQAIQEKETEMQSQA